MKTLIKLFLTIWLILGMSSIGAANVPIITADELRPGMRGYAKTVVKGADIVTFDVEILGVTGSEASGRSILVKASGPVIDACGGIAQGMSGSPVYVGGRLAGAVAYGKSFSDPSYCFLTPIEEMLKMLDEKNPRPSVFAKSTPLMVSGFSQAGAEYLKEKLADKNMQVYTVPAGGQELENVDIEPGSSLGVSMVRGDMQVGAIGTVTWVGDDGRILALGHRFLRRGELDYFLTNAWIYSCIPNLQSSYKVGSIGKTLGIIRQDRSTGVAGKLGEYPKIIPMFVSATDKTTGRHQTCSVQLVTDEDLVPVIVDSIAYNTAERAYDQVGGGTSKLSFKITARGEDSGEISLARENMFYHPGDVSKHTNDELMFACELLMKNKFEKVTVFDINVDSEFTTDYEVAEIVKAKAPARAFQPGEKIPLTVVLKPYRGKEFEKVLEFPVPKDRAKGKLPLIIRSGNSFVWLNELLKKKKAEGEALPTFEKRKDLLEFVKDFNEADANNDLIVDVLPKAGAKKKSARTKLSSKDKEDTLNELLKGSKYKQKFPMEFITDGEVELSVNVGAAESGDNE